MSRRRKLAFAALTVLLVLGAAEIALRAAGFRYHRITSGLEFNYPRPAFLREFFEIEPVLLYRIRPSVRQRYVDLTWQPDFDLKIRDHRRHGAKPAGTTRIVVLGDSSTYGVNTRDPWPARLEQRLSAAGAAGRYEVLNLGVPGYTAFQGRRILESRGERLAADIVVVAFGWNDHLLALGFTDAEQRVGSPAAVALRNRLAASRVYQALSFAAARLRPSSAPAVGEGRPPKRRVGSEDFAAELARIAAAARRLGARVILCTYPTGLGLLAAAGMEPPTWMVETHLGTGSLADLVGLQREYNDIVRRVARQTGSGLADLEAELAPHVAELFAPPPGDPIHPNENGYDAVAAVVAGAIERTP